MWRRASYLLVGLTLMACAAATSSRPLMRSAGREVLTAAEIVTSHVTDAYQAVLQLRPEFLRRRPAAVPAAPYAAVPITVYLDDMPFGPAESLRSIPLDRVRIIRYVSPTEADLKWGGSHPGGAIAVVTLKAR